MLACKRRKSIKYTAAFLFFFFQHSHAIDNFYVNPVYIGTIYCGEDNKEPCEPSGVTLLVSNGANNLQGVPALIVNDKTQKENGRTPVISVDVMPDNTIRQRGYVQIPGNPIANKLEGITTSLEGNYIVATTSYDRHDETNKYLGYNKLVAWNSRQIISDSFEIVAKSTQNSNKDISIRAMLQDAIADHTKSPATYFKIEGISFLPKNKICFSVREVGLSFENFKYMSIILIAEYIESDGKIYINGDTPIKVGADFTETIQKSTGLSLGISDITYNKHDKRLYFLTSQESVKDGKKQLDAFLWSAVIDENYPILPSGLSMAKSISTKSTFHFLHKAEGLVFLTDNRLIVVHDDDRELLPLREGSAAIRELNQAFYTILDIVEEPEKQFPSIRKSSDRRLWEDINIKKPNAVK